MSTRSPHAGIPRPTVYKIGGSLLRLPDLFQRLRGLLGQAAYPVVFPGGGAAADAVRDWHDRFSLDEPAAHALAMQSLSLTARLLEQLLPEARLCIRPADVNAAWEDDDIPVIDPSPWFAQSPGWFTEPAKLATGLLPKSWNVTSDTLAACAAVDLSAQELILVKSVAPPPDGSLSTAADSGLVDLFCPQVADQLPVVRWVNLSDPERPVTTLSKAQSPRSTR